MPMENMRKATPTSAMVSTASGLGMSPRAEGPHSTPVSRKPTMDGRRKRRQTRTTMMERIKRTTISRRIMSSMGQSRRKGYGEVNHVFTSLLFCHVFRPHATERRTDAGGGAFARRARSEGGEARPGFESRSEGRAEIAPDLRPGGRPERGGEGPGEESGRAFKSAEAGAAIFPDFFFGAVAGRGRGAGGIL